MRGTAARKCEAFFRLGITPAHAGNSLVLESQFPVNQDHPRTCGEQGAAAQRTVRDEGSPPHMRGTGVLYRSFEFPLGITPAHAGNSDGTEYELRRHTDHPRTCGEQTICDWLTDGTTGSPPHMRGTASDSFKHTLEVGITPAHAGNSVMG